MPPVTSTVPVHSRARRRRAARASRRPGPRRRGPAAAARRSPARSARRVVVVGVDQDEPAGMLGLRRPHQTPHRRGRGVVTADRTAGHERERARVLAGQPVLDALAEPMLSTRVRDRRTPPAASQWTATTASGRHVRFARRGPAPSPGANRESCVVAVGRHRRAVSAQPADATGPPAASRHAARAPCRRRAGQAHADGRGAGGVQRERRPRRTAARRAPPAPGTRWRAARRRAAPGAARRRPLGVVERDLGEDVAAAPPRRAQAAERRAVVEPVVGQPLVEVVDGHRVGPGRRPLGEVEVGDGRVGGQRAGRRAGSTRPSPVDGSGR